LASDAEIRKILVQRVDTDQQSVGIVVGVIEPKGRRVVAYGALDKDDKRPLNGDTIFEIGSVTKVFTSLTLADMVQRGEVALSDPIAKYLPPGVKVPERGGHTITLLDLSTQTSGLPRLPSNLVPKDPANPYADYSAENLYQFLSTYQLTRDIGSQYEYSNLGVGLLGQVLARRSGYDYEALVTSRIARPLEMTSTRIALTPEMKARFAVGHNDQLKPVPNWDFQALAGCGALRSSANDLLAFLAANLGYTKSPLASAMAAMLKGRRPTGSPELEIALGWHIFTGKGNEIVWHDGGTHGYRSFVGFDPKTRAGVVVLSNTFTAAGIDDIGLHLLDAQRPLIKLQPAKDRKEAAVDTKLFDGYVGRYKLAPSFILTVTREGAHLFAQATGQGKAEIFPESEHEYFYKVVDAQITFKTDKQGQATELVLHQNGQDMPAKRLEGEAAAAPKERKAIAVDPKLFDGYVGRYELAPNFILSVTREGSQLFVQATGQPKFEVFPETERDYFLTVVDAQVTFHTDANGRATDLVLHQNGANVPGKRIE
jgi:CubicO group peptidase (beta-lactamase class C family)